MKFQIFSGKEVIFCKALQLEIIFTNKIVKPNYCGLLSICHNPTNNPKKLKQLLLWGIIISQKNHTTPGPITIRKVLGNPGTDF
jgi:hypothetical protein